MSTLTQHDTLTAIAWLLGNGVLAVCAWRWARRWQPWDGLFPMVLHAFVLAWAVVVVVSFALAVAGGLTGWNLLGTVTLLAMLGLYLPLRPPPRPAPSWPPFWPLIWMAIAALWGSHNIIRGLLVLPAGWDTLAYHLPLVDSWLQARNLYAPDCAYWSVPGNLELLGLWFVAPFSGDFWIGITNLPVTVLLAIVSYQIARQLGVGESLAHLSALAVVSNGIVWSQLITLDTDTAVAALFGACLFYGLRYAREGRNADLGYGAAASGLLAGVKYYALGYVVIAGLAALVFARVYRRRAAFRISVIWIMLGLTFGGYWYVRNMVATGNPLYPMQFRGGLASGSGGGWTSTFLGSGRWEVVPLGLQTLLTVGGPCLLAASLVFPLAIVALVVFGWNRQEKGQPVALRPALALLAIAVFGVFLITPYAVEAKPNSLDQLRWEPRTPVRYGLCWENLTLGLAAIVGHDVARRWPTGGTCLNGLVGALLVGQYGFVFLNPTRGLNQEVSKGLELTFPDTYLVAVDLFMAAYVLHSSGCISWTGNGGRRWLTSAAGLAVVLWFLVATAWLSQNWQEKFVRDYSKLFDDKILESLRDRVPVGSKVCVMDARPYPFFGPSRAFRVCQPTTIRTEADLISFLDEHEVPFLVIRAKTNPFAETLPDFQIASRAIAAFPGKWQPLYHGRAYLLYRLGRPQVSVRSTDREGRTGKRPLLISTLEALAQLPS